MLLIKSNNKRGGAKKRSGRGRETFFFFTWPYNTRYSNAFYSFSCRTNIRQFAIRFHGPKLFNSFNTEIQNADSFSQFKSKFKTFLLN